MKLTKFTESQTELFKEIRDKLPPNTKAHLIFSAQIERDSLLKDNNSQKFVAQKIKNKYGIETSKITNFFQETGLGTKIIKSHSDGTLDEFSLTLENNATMEETKVNIFTKEGFLSNLSKWTEEDLERLSKFAIQVRTDISFEIEEKRKINEELLKEL